MKRDYSNIELKKIPGAKVAIIATGWHRDHLDRMIEASSELLVSAGATTTTFNVPGSYEIPLVAKVLARKGDFDAIIAYGIIVKGDTDHYEVIRDTCTTELGKVMTEFEVPIIMEILPVYKIEHAIERTQGRNNKGIEAAQAAAEMISLLRELKQS